MHFMVLYCYILHTVLHTVYCIAYCLYIVLHTVYCVAYNLLCCILYCMQHLLFIEHALLCKRVLLSEDALGNCV